MQGEINVVKNRYGEVNVEKRAVAGTNVFAEIEVVDYMDDTVSMWLSKNELKSLRDEIDELLKSE